MRPAIHAMTSLFTIMLCLPAAAEAPPDTPFALEAAIALDNGTLESYRAGAGVNNNIRPGGLVDGNAANNIVSGMNSVSEGAFANASGLPIVIQNSGANVLIQNATIVNIQLQ